MPRTSTYRRLGAVLGIAVILIVGVAYLLLRQTSSPEQRAADAKPPAKAVATAQVVKRVLTESISLRGRVSPGSPVSVGMPLLGEGARAVVTAAAPGVGSELVAGDLLFAVANHPVFVFKGSIALYRDIVPGMSGPDVASLQRALEDAGLYAGGPTGSYDWSTQQAVSGLWKSKGFTAQRPMGIEDKLAAAQQAADAAIDPQMKATATKSLQAVQSLDGPIVPATSITMVTSLPAMVVNSQALLGAVLSPSATPVTLSSSAPTISLDASGPQATMVQPGQTVIIQLSDGSTVHGTVSVGSAENGTSPTESGPDSPSAGSTPGAPAPQVGSGTSPQITVDTSDPLPLTAINQQVSAKILATSTTDEVLAVPVSAIRMTDQGAATVVVMDGSQRRSEVAIQTGRIIGGWAEITASSPQLKVDDSVVVGASR